MFRSLKALGLAAALALGAAGTTYGDSQCTHVSTDLVPGYTARVSTRTLSANFVGVEVKSAAPLTSCTTQSGFQLRWHTDTFPVIFSGCGVDHYVFPTYGGVDWGTIDLGDLYCELLLEYVTV